MQPDFYTALRKAGFLMPALYILIGPAGVGKTSLATGISAGNPVSTDAIRIE